MTFIVVLFGDFRNFKHFCAPNNTTLNDLSDPIRITWPGRTGANHS